MLRTFKDEIDAILEQDRLKHRITSLRFGLFAIVRGPVARHDDPAAIGLPALVGCREVIDKPGVLRRAGRVVVLRADADVVHAAIIERVPEAVVAAVARVEEARHAEAILERRPVVVVLVVANRYHVPT